jgi:hypothetical protein
MEQKKGGGRGWNRKRRGSVGRNRKGGREVSKLEAVTRIGRKGLRKKGLDGELSCKGSSSGEQVRGIV